MQSGVAMTGTATCSFRGVALGNETIELILARLNRLEILIYFCLIGSIPDILSVTGGIQ